MFGLGNRTTSYAFAAAALFLFVAGQPYYKYAFASLVCALALAYMKVFEVENNRREDGQRREIDYRFEDLKEDLYRKENTRSGK